MMLRTYLASRLSLVALSTFSCLLTGLIFPTLVRSGNFNPSSGTGGGSPSQTGPLGSHGPCDLNTQSGETPQIVALLPNQSDWITTVDAHPTFWFYMPFAASEFPSIQFVLRNAAGEKIDDQTLQLNNTQPGFLSVQVSANAPEMEVGQQYRWTMVFTCAEGAEMTIRNLVSRVAPTPQLQEALSSARTPQEQALAYASNGIWLDALTVLGDRRRTDASDTEVTDTWTELLLDEDVDLQVPSAPMMDCCRLTP
jgi:Domain of Unknown Function (DUF928)